MSIKLIRQVPADFPKQWIQYISELNTYTDRLQGDMASEREAEKIAQNLADNPYYDTYTIFSDSECVGFLIAHDVDVDDTFFIDEFFILPRYRRNGYAMMAVAEYLQLHFHNNRGQLFIIKDNEPAWRFWQKAIKANGFHITKACKATIVDKELTDCILVEFEAV